MNWLDHDDNMILANDRDEARSARYHALPATCYGVHHMGSDGAGGGVCECGASVSADEL